MQRWNILGDSNSGTTNFFYVLVKQMQVQSIFKRRKKPWEGLSFRNEKSEDVTKRRTTAIITVINWFKENSDFKFCPYITKWKGKALPLWIYWATCSHKFRIYFWGLCFTSYLLLLTFDSLFYGLLLTTITFSW